MNPAMTENEADERDHQTRRHTGERGRETRHRSCRDASIGDHQNERPQDRCMADQVDPAEWVDRGQHQGEQHQRGEAPHER